MTIARNRAFILSFVFLAGVIFNCGGGGGGGDSSDRTGKAVVPLYYNSELGVVDLLTGDTLSSVAPTIWAGEVIMDPAGTRVFMLSYDDSNIAEYTISGDDLVYAETHVIYTSTFDDMYPFNGIWANGNLAVIYDNHFLIYNPDTSAAAYTYTYEDGVSDRGIWDVTANSAGTRYFLADYYNDTILVFDNNAALLESVVYSDGGSGISDTADAPVAVALSPDGTRLYAANYTSDDMVIFSVDMTSGALSYLEFVEFPADMDLYNSHGMIVTPDGGEVWIACDDSSTVGVYNTDTGNITVIELDSPSLQAAPTDLAFGPDGNYVYAPGSNYSPNNTEGTDNLYVIDVDTKSVVDTLSVPSVSSPATTSQPCGIGIF